MYRILSSKHPSPCKRTPPPPIFDDPVVHVYMYMRYTYKLASSPGFPAFFGGYAKASVASEEVGKPGDKATYKCLCLRFPVFWLVNSSTHVHLLQIIQYMYMYINASTTHTMTRPWPLPQEVGPGEGDA